MKMLLAIAMLLAVLQLGVCQQITNDTVHADTYRQTEPSIAAARDTNGVIHLAVSYKHQIGSVEIARAYSNDTGKTWHYDSIVPSYFQPNNDPSIAFDTKRGYAYNTFLSVRGTWLCRSTDWGQTWAATGPQLSDTTLPNDATVLAVDNDPGSSYNGNVYVATGDDPDIVFCRSTDQGATYDTLTTQLNDNGTSGFDLPQLCVGKGGVVYLISGAGDSSIFNYSTNAGTTWNYGTNGLTGKKLFAPAMNREGSGLYLNGAAHKFISIACQPTSDTVYFAYEAASVIKFGYTADSGKTFRGQTTIPKPSVNLTTCEPWIAVDQNDNLYIAYYGESDTLACVYVAVSTDHGSTWSTQYIASNAYSANNDFSFNGVGDYLSIAALDATHVYVIWSDKRTGKEQVYFAALNATDVQYRNALGGVYSARHLVLDASGANDTVPSLAMEHYSSPGSHTAQPDSNKYHNVVTTHGWNFLFQNWNQGSSPSDSVFIHSFSVNPSVLGTQEADFANIDTLRVINNCDGLINNGTAELQVHAASSWNSGTSPVFTDTAIQSKTYNVKTDTNVIIVNGVHFNFEQWANGDTNLTNGTAFSTAGDTTVQAYFHANMRADAALYWNNQRKIAYEGLTGSHGRYWFTYVSHGNVYLTRSTDTSTAPAGCAWDSARRVNTHYGHGTNPSIAWLPGEGALNPYPAPRVIVVWEDTTTIGNTITRDVKYSIYDTSGTVNASNNPLTATSISSALPCAPMVCPILHNDLNKYYGDAVVVWADGQKDSLFITVVDPISGIRGGPIYVPQSNGGEFPAVEPGYNRPDTALNDPADFDMTWHDSSGIKYDYLILNTATDSLSNGHIFDYKTPEGHPEQVIDTSWFGTNAHASLAVANNAEPLIAWEQNGVRLIFAGKDSCWYDSDHHPIGCSLMPRYLGRTGIMLRSKVRHDSAWGGFVFVGEYANYDFVTSVCGATESFFAPSVTIYNDENSYCHLYWTHGISASCGEDYIKQRYISLASVAGGITIPDTTVATANGRTPAQPYSQFTKVAQNRMIWAQDSATTEIMKRDHSCNAPDNYVSVGINDYNQAYVHWNDTASFSFISGEYAMKDSAGNVTAVHQQQLNLVTPVHSINDAANQMRSQNFKIHNNTVKLIFYNAPILTDTTKSLHALGATRVVTFKVELRDSSNGSLLQTLAQIGITGSFTSLTLPLGMDTVTVTGKSGKTCYFRLSVDTTNAPTTFSVTPGQVYSENLLSSVVSSDTSSLGKEIEAYHAAIAPSTDNPIGLTVFPNPTSGVASILFSVPVEDAAYVTEVKVFNMLGKDVSTLVKDVRPAGKHSVEFDGTALPSGRYIVAVHTVNHTQSKLMILEK